MSELASTKDPGEGEVYTYGTVWDAHQMHGCLCDPGFSGYACQLRSCPTGDDPLTEPTWPSLPDCHGASASITGTYVADAACEGNTLQDNCVAQLYADATTTPTRYCCWKDDARCRARFMGDDAGLGETAQRTLLKESVLENYVNDLDEIQIFRCIATAGVVTLIFRGETTARIPVSASQAEFKAALEALPTINGVEVSFSETTLSNTLCTKSSIKNIVTVTFKQDFGDLPQMRWSSTVTTMCVASHINIILPRPFCFVPLAPAHVCAQLPMFIMTSCKPTDGRRRERRRCAAVRRGCVRQRCFARRQWLRAASPYDHLSHTSAHQVPSCGVRWTWPELMPAPFAERSRSIDQLVCCWFSSPSRHPDARARAPGTLRWSIL